RHTRSKRDWSSDVCSSDLLPSELTAALRAGLRAFDRKLAGYTAPEAILTGLETRTSSPVRLVRGEHYECTQLAGLYPCGEGAGRSEERRVGKGGRRRRSE